MFEKIRNIFRIPDLRKRVLFTLGILAVYRLGSQIPTPGVNLKLLAQFFDQQAGSALGLVDLFSGGSFRRLTVFALGIMPYITASIILQLLTVVCHLSRSSRRKASWGGARLPSGPAT